MFKAKNGKRFGSIFAGRKYDENHSEDGVHSEGGKPEHEATETPEFEAGEQEGAVEHKAEGEETPTEEHSGETHPVVAEHGPAHKVVISHDEKSGRHVVTSHHSDGHVHSAVHKTKHDAHKEAQKLAAAEEMEQKPKAEEHSEAGESDGFQMPGLE